MDEIHRQLLLQHDVSLYVLGFVILMSFLGMLLTFWAIYQTSGLREEAMEERREARRAREVMAEEMRSSRESSERIAYYLFGKLGPLDTK